MEKESLSIIAVKTILAIAIFTGVGTIIVGGGWLIKGQDNDKSFKQLPTLCKDNLDCPSQMKCENYICVDVECAKEGDLFQLAPDLKTHVPSVCCEGLKMIAISGYYDKDCNINPKLRWGVTWSCSNCGNGICEENLETKCNCPEDCEDEDETADWKTYRNEEYEFEVKYPEDWYSYV